MNKMMIVVIVLLVAIVTASVFTSITGASERISTYLPLVSNGLLRHRPYRDTPTPAPTRCHDDDEDGQCDPTATPYIICFPATCTPVPPNP